MNGILKRPALIAFLFLVASGAFAQPPLYVAISQSQFTTFTSVSIAGGPISIPPTPGITVSRTNTSTSPISDEIDQTIPIYQTGAAGGVTHAIANTSYFGVSDETGWGFATASASSQIWFSPVADETTSIGVQILAESETEYYYTAGSITLVDLTANTQLWNYTWNGIVGGLDNIPWDNSSGVESANLNLETSFLASDQYELDVEYEVPRRDSIRSLSKSN